MNRPVSIALTLGIVATVAAQAQDASLKVKESTESQIHFHATNYGIFGLNVYNNQGGFYSPRGSTYGYLFGSGLWFGAKKMVTDSMGESTLRPLVFLTYNPNSGTSWAYPYEWPVAHSLPPYPDLYHSPDFDHATGAYSSPIKPPGGPRPWPMWLRSGETTRPMFPGHFEPSNDNRSSSTGIYTAVSFMPDVDEQFVCRYHDMALERYEIGQAEATKRGYPLGLLIEQNIYGWRTGRYSEAVVIDYMVMNRSNDTLRDCVLGQASDPDLGQAGNDHVEFYNARPELRITRAWTDREVQGTWGQLAMVLLEAPVIDSQSFIDNTRRSDFNTSGLIGSFPAWTIDTDPVTDGDRYDFMTNGTLATDNGPGDKRAMLASTTFNMRPGDTAHFVIAYAVLHGSFGATRPKGFMLGKEATPEDDGAIESFASAIASDYYSGRFKSLSTQAGTASGSGGDELALTIAPNPVQGATLIAFSIPTRSTVTLRLVDPLGRQVATRAMGTLPDGLHQTTLDLAPLASGTYMLVLEADGATEVRRIEIVR